MGQRLRSSLYFAFVLIGVLALGASAVLFYVGAVKASRKIHARLVDRIFACKTRFLDSTPVGRIVSRFTKDMKSIDGMFTEVSVNAVLVSEIHPAIS
jgi:ABC-type multidrug transport system fused ATPase/permease subunit